MLYRGIMKEMSEDTTVGYKAKEAPKMDAETLSQAQGVACYASGHLYNADGSVSAHYADGVQKLGMRWENLMQDPQFADVIAHELQAEKSADKPLMGLAKYMPEGMARELFVKWLAFMNVDLQPWVTGGAIHFRPHWARVLALVLNLGVREGLSAYDLNCLAVSAVFHDSRRKDPYLDTGHGARAAEYYRRFCRENERGAERHSAAGRSLTFDPRAYLIMQWHDRDDEEGIAAMEATFGDTSSAPHDAFVSQNPLVTEATCDPKLLYRLFKDADGLDRVRLGEGEPNTAYLRTAYSLELLDLAHRMVDESQFNVSD